MFILNKINVGYPRLIFSIIGLFFANLIIAQTWVDSLDTYLRKEHLPASRFYWSWQHSTAIYGVIAQIDLRPENEQKQYLDYAIKAMDENLSRVKGKTPNAVASGLAMAYLWGKTKDEKYKKACDKIYRQYQSILRTPQGGVSHLSKNAELWDDTIFMIGQFLLQMYLATGDEKYMNELMAQIKIHREKLQDKKTKLWYHGWDADDKMHLTFCSQANWPDKITRQSAELWGRGNGWIVVTLSDILTQIPREHKYWKTLGGYLQEMIVNLPTLQDKKTGHWYQLPVRNQDPDNFIESSCTAMFAYGILSGLKLNLIKGEQYQESINNAYKGLRKYSIEQKGEHLITTNICTGTCIGDKDYYLNRRTKKVKSFGLAMFIQFGLNYEHYLK